MHPGEKSREGAAPLKPKGIRAWKEMGKKNKTAVNRFALMAPSISASEISPRGSEKGETTTNHYFFEQSSADLWKGP